MQPTQDYISEMKKEYSNYKKTTEEKKVEWYLGAPTRVAPLDVHVAMLPPPFPKSHENY